jgi:hypothetical protein
MAIDPSIALGIRPLQLADPLAQYSQFAQIQNAQNQNALAQYQLGAAQRAEAKDVARTNALMAAGPDEDAIANALLKIGDVTSYSALMKAKEERQKTNLERNKLTNEIVDQRLKQSRSFLDTLDPTDPDIAVKLKSWHLGNHADEYLGPVLKRFGATTENSTAEIDKAIAGGPAKIEEFLNRSRLAADKFADFMQRQNDVRQITGGVQAGTPPQMGAPFAAAMPAAALPTVAPSVAAPPSRINFVKSEINRFSNVLSNNPSNKLAADRLQALTTEYNQLSAEAGRQATLQQSAKQHEATLEEAKRHNKALENKDPEAVRAYEYAVKQGFKGTYADWVQSNQAKPADIQAYEYAKTNDGYKGTLQEWIQSKSKNQPSADIQAYEYAKGQGYTGSFPQWVKDKATWGRAPGTNISIVNTPTAKSLSEPVGKMAETSLAKAQGAADTMESANQIRAALNAGNVIAGPLAGARTKFAQVLETAGIGDKEKLANTRNAIQGLAAMTLASRGDLKGQGQITDMETKLLERAKSADIGDLTIGELHQIVNTAQKVSNRLWSNHQTLLKTMESDPEAASARKYYAPTGSIPEALGDQTSSKPSGKDNRQSLNDIFGRKKP